jgi:hypothetical protein
LSNRRGRSAAHQNHYIAGKKCLPGDVSASGRRLPGALWLIPLVSVADVLWAIAAKAGLVFTFGMGLYKWENIHIAVQVVLIILLSIVFVISSASGEESIDVEGDYVPGPAEQKGH